MRQVYALTYENLSFIDRKSFLKKTSIPERQQYYLLSYDHVQAVVEKYDLQLNLFSNLTKAVQFLRKLEAEENLSINWKSKNFTSSDYTKNSSFRAVHEYVRRVLNQQGKYLAHIVIPDPEEDTDTPGYSELVMIIGTFELKKILIH